MILVYTGNGKGKTSASVGQAIRALGQGMRVGFFQYMKRGNAAGEQKILRSLLGGDFVAGGLGFLRKPEQFAAHREAGRQLTERVISRIPDLDMLVLDEALYALKAAVLTREELRDILTLCEKGDTHVVLSGRDAPRWLTEAAHLVTEMREVKHPHTRGVPAERGIEF
jgi:cob(I)alamin adenosyltransferase